MAAASLRGYLGDGLGHPWPPWPPCEVVPWWSSGVTLNIRQGMYTPDGDINLLFSLVVSTLVYFICEVDLFVCDASICS